MLNADVTNLRKEDYLIYMSFDYLVVQVRVQLIHYRPTSRHFRDKELALNLKFKPAGAYI